MEYTNKTAVQNYLLINIDSSFDTQLTAYIKAMSEYMDAQAGFPIYRDAEETRLYDGNGQCALRIDPVHGTLTVVSGEETLTTEEYVARPYNNPVKREIVLKSGYFSPGQANISVTGKFSLHSELKEQVKWACTVLVALIINQVNNQGEGVQSEKIGEYQVSFRTQQERNDFKLAKEIIASTARITF